MVTTQQLSLAMPQAYPSDLSDDQWGLLEALLPPAKPGGRPRSVNLRQVLNAILYILCTGCPWRYLPNTHPPYQTVYDYFARWREDGTWEQVHEHLRQWTRAVECDRPPHRLWRWWIANPFRHPPWCLAKWDMTEPRNSKGANDISWWIAWGSSSVGS